MATMIAVLLVALCARSSQQQTTPDRTPMPTPMTPMPTPMKRCDHASSASDRTCGHSNQCKWLETYRITTPQSDRTSNCEARVVKTNDACQNNSCRDCVWDDWGSYDTCTRTCGGGTQTRRRSQKTARAGAGKACEGNNSQTRNCNEDPCPVDCAVSDWSPWSACSGTCTQFVAFPVTRRRIRAASQPKHGGKECPHLDEVQECGVPICVTKPDETFAPSPPPTPFPPQEIPTLAPTTDPNAPPPSTTNGGASQMSDAATTTRAVNLNIRVVDEVTEVGQPSIPLSNGIWLQSVDTSGGMSMLELTKSATGVGTRVMGSATPDGEIAAPAALVLTFPEPRVLKSLKLSGFDGADSGKLIGYNPVKRKRQTGADVAIYTDAQLTGADVTGLEARTGYGYTSYRIVPDDGSSFGLESFEAGLPDPNYVPPPPVDQLSDEKTPESALPFAWWIFLIIGIACLCCCCLIIIFAWLIGSRDSDSSEDDIADETNDYFEQTIAPTTVASANPPHQSQQMAPDTFDSSDPFAESVQAQPAPDTSNYQRSPTFNGVDPNYNAALLNGDSNQGLARGSEVMGGAVAYGALSDVTPVQYNNVPATDSIQYSGLDAVGTETQQISYSGLA